MADYLRINAQSEDRVMISDAFKNLELRAKGSVLIGTAPTAPSRVYTGTVAVSGMVNPCIAVLGGKCGLISRTSSGSSFTFKLMAEASRTVTYFVFDDPVNSQAGSYGLVVRNAAGEVCFDALKKYMRVLGTINATGSSSGIAVPSGKTGAILLGYGGNRISVAGGIVGSGPSWLVQVTNTVIMGDIVSGTAQASTFDMYTFSNEGASGAPQPTPGIWGSLVVNYLLLDVTNY